MADLRFLLVLVCLTVAIHTSAQFSVYDTEYIVEVLVVVDQPSLDAWLNKDGVNSKDDVIAEITSMFREADFMYQSFRAYGINIRLRIFDFIFPDYSLLEGKITYTNSGSYIEHSAGLYAVANYVNNQDKVPLSGFDHSMFFTATPVKDATGVAWQGTICNRYWAISLVNAQFSFYMAIIVAHEIGHSLVLSHDADPCKSGKYVMCPEYIQGYNRWFFSPCSADQLYGELEKKGQDSCLTTTSSEPIVSRRMGELLTPDQFCKRVWGVGVKPQSSGPEDLCYMLKCWDGYYTTYSTATPEGMACDDGKRCYMANCL